MRVMGQEIAGISRFSHWDEEVRAAIFDCEIDFDDTGLVTYMEVWLLDDYCTACWNSPMGRKGITSFFLRHLSASA